MSNILNVSTISVLTGLIEALLEIRDGVEQAKAKAILENDKEGQAIAQGAINAYSTVIAAVMDSVNVVRIQQVKEEANKHPQDKDYMREAAKVIESKLPDNFGFLLLAAPYGDKEGRLLYTSSIERADAVCLVKEWLLKAGAAEDWMKHIK